MANASLDDETALEWRTDVSLLGQPTMIANFFKVIVIAAGVMSALFAFLALIQGTPGEIVPLLRLTAVCVGVVAAIMLLVMIVFFRNRMGMAFRVDADAARSAVIDRRAKAAGKTALVVGALSGKPQLLGAGLIASTSSSQSLAWSAVRKASYSPRWRTIKLANSWRTAMILFCDASNYDEVARFVENAVRASPHRIRPNPLPGLLLRSALTVVASAPLFGLPYPITVDMLAPLLVLAFALMSVWFLPIFGWAVFGGLAWVAVEAAAAGFSTYVSDLTGETLPRFELMGDGDWEITGVALLGAAYLIGQSVALLKGKWASALAGDMDESGAPQKAEAPPPQVAPPPLPAVPPPLPHADPLTPRFCAFCGARLDAAGRCPNCGGATRG
jgi:hypothetical protein